VHDQALASPLREGLQSLTSLVADRKAGHYTKFIDGEFLRATAKDRAEYNKVALGGAGAPGRATINESATGTTWTNMMAATTSTRQSTQVRSAGWRANRDKSEQDRGAELEHVLVRQKPLCGWRLLNPQQRRESRRSGTAAVGPEAEVERLGRSGQSAETPGHRGRHFKGPALPSFLYEIFISQGVDPSGIQMRS